MKTSLLFLFSLLLACTALSAAEPAPLSVAVLGFGAQKDIEPESEKLALLLGVQLSEHPELQLVERVEIEKVLSEQELSLTGTIQPDTAAKIGHIIGAQVLITGRLIDVSGKRMAVVKLIGVETSRVVSVSAEFAGEPGVADAAKKLSGQITEKLRDPKSAFTAEVESWDAMIVRLKALLPAGKERPSVRVQIPEQHLTRRVPDPAAQTELQRVLQQLGFTLVDSGPADYTVEGEAFSERGGQRGQMIFCKARLEVKVANAKHDKIWVDRQTSSAVDLAENIAAKTALQHAGRSVAERLVAQYFAASLKP
ncbi:CsgG/HfaB family protein [Prosthecobacter sp.]|uniref:CsgG/HfaB family protein n=1 Tax=Prosthecobacter sp. TaxID=1965333 RepID=UPI00378375A4